MKIGKPNQAFHICFEEDKIIPLRIKKKDECLFIQQIKKGKEDYGKTIVFFEQENLELNYPLALQRWESKWTSKCKWTKKDFTGGLTQYRLVAKLGTYIHTTQPINILASVELVVIQG